MKLIIFLFGLIFVSDAFAIRPIVRNFSSVRAQGMGNVRYSTGLYDENFFANPARATENPESRFQLPKISIESNMAAVKTLRDLLKNSSSGLRQFANAVGEPLSARAQMIFPAYYQPEFINSKWAFGIGMMTAIESHSQFSQIGTIDPSTRFSIGPVITLARRFLEENRLSVGVNVHTEYHMGLQDQVGIVEFLGGKSIQGKDLGGNGLGVDFDFGTSFRPHWTWLGATYEVAFAVNNVLGGYYKNLGRPNKVWNDDPTPIYRTYNFGVSMNKQKVLVFDELITAFEVTDIGNNKDGSAFRLLHIGTEANWGLFSGRFGINQGYLCGGLGWDVGFMDVNLATYGEEMTLNAGGLEDRRYAVEFGFQI